MYRFNELDLNDLSSSPGQTQGSKAEPKFSTAATSFNNENLPSVTNRPANVLYRMLEKMPFNTFTGMIPDNDSSQDLSSRAQQKVLSATLEQRITKMLKYMGKSQNLKRELVRDFHKWSDDIPDPECTKMVKAFADTLLTEKYCHDSIVNRLTEMKNQLHFVNEREKKQKDLENNGKKLQKQRDESMKKYGPNSLQAALLAEAIEENSFNMNIVGMQFVRSVTGSLKESFLEYLRTSHNSYVKVLNLSNRLYLQLKESSAYDWSPKNLEREEKEPVEEKEVTQERRYSYEEPYRVDIANEWS